MCFGSPDLPSPTPPPAPVAPAEALKQVSQDAQASRDNTMRRMASRMSLQSTNLTNQFKTADEQPKSQLGV
jgi:hypothetical protein